MSLIRSQEFLRNEINKLRTGRSRFGGVVKIPRFLVHVINQWTDHDTERGQSGGGGEVTDEQIIDAEFRNARYHLVSGGLGQSPAHLEAWAAAAVRSRTRKRYTDRGVE